VHEYIQFKINLFKTKFDLDVTFMAKTHFIYFLFYSNENHVLLIYLNTKIEKISMFGISIFIPYNSKKTQNSQFFTHN